MKAAHDKPYTKKPRYRLATLGLTAFLSLGATMLSATTDAAQSATPPQTAAPAAAAPKAVLPEAVLPEAELPEAAAPEAPTAEEAPPIQVQAKLSKTNPVFGERVELRINLTYPSDLRVFFPARPNLKPLLTLPEDPGSSKRSESNGMITETLIIPALVVRTGLLKTPPIEIPYHRITSGGGAGESGTVEVPPLRATVRSQFSNETDVKASPLPAPLPLVEDNMPLKVGLLVLAMMMLAAALTALGLRLYRRRTGREEIKPQIPPHIIALGRIEELIASGRIGEQEPRLVYGEISGILREYLTGRYSFAALDMTSTELLRSLQAVDLRGLTLEDFENFTATSDLIKFARQGASADEISTSLAFVRDVIERTMQSPEEIERLKAQRLARLARQKRLRVQIMAPAPLRLQSFAIDVLLGTFATFLVAWLAIDTDKRGLFDVAYSLLFLWLVIRDTLGEGSPGKAIAGLRIARLDPQAEIDPEAALRDDAAASLERAEARMASLGSRLKRNLLMALPGAGIVTEAITCLSLPELRRLGDQWAKTRVIDARYGLRTHQTGWWSGALLLVASLGLLLLPLLALGGRPL